MMRSTLLTTFLWVQGGWGFSASEVPLEPTQKQLHWNELGHMLMRLKQQQGLSDTVLLQTRLDLPTLHRVRIGPSTIEGAGRGLFATMDCQPGDLLTCYPGDVLLHKTGLTGLPEYLKQDDQRLRLLLKSYCVGVTDDYAIMGLPERDDNVAYAGHFINDGVTKPPTCEAELEDYMKESQAVENCDFLPLENLHMVALANRHIKKGDEIFTFYGPVYWMDQASTWRGEHQNEKPGAS